MHFALIDAAIMLNGRLKAGTPDLARRQPTVSAHREPAPTASPTSA